MLEVKANIKGSFTEYDCDECKVVDIQNEDPQTHILKCPIINTGKNLTESEYTDLFIMDVPLQINVSQEILENFKIREAFKKHTCKMSEILPNQDCSFPDFTKSE